MTYRGCRGHSGEPALGKFIGPPGGCNDGRLQRLTCRTLVLEDARVACNLTGRGLCVSELGLEDDQRRARLDLDIRPAEELGPLLEADLGRSVVDSTVASTCLAKLGARASANPRAAVTSTSLLPSR